MSIDSRIHGKAPLRILCQHEHGSCGACCGAYNFTDRSPAAEDARLRRRTEMVGRAWPDPVALAAARDELLALERPEVLFAGVKVCPFAGYVELPGGLDDAAARAATKPAGSAQARVDEGADARTTRPGRIGCLLHPTRHPDGADLRDLAVYPKEVCAGHFCAPHDWLRPREMDLAQTVRGTHYGRVVTDAGLVKALTALVDEALGRPFAAADLSRAAAALAAMWRELRAWPWADPDPTRFGGFQFHGDDAVERTLPSALAGTRVAASSAERTVLDALGTRSLSDDEATAALAQLHALVTAVAREMQRA